MKTNDFKNAKAITLIAMIVTLIVLLILAGVSIAVLTGENGILNRATSAKQTNEQKTAEEELKLGVSALSIDYRKNATNPQTFKEFVVSNEGLTELKKAMGLAANNTELVVEDAANGVLSYKGQKYQVSDFGGVGEYVPPKFAGLSSEDATLPEGVTEVAYANVANTNLKDTNKIKAVIKGTGTNNSDEVPIPVNAKYKEGTENTGVVIEYKGSEFVWVPVPVAIKDTNNPSGAKPMAKVSTVEGYASGDDTNPNYEGVLYNFSGSGDSVISNEISSCGQGTESYREPDKLADYDTASYEYLKNIGFEKNNQSDPDAFLNTLISDYKEMVESVAKYGGFYVGRYETSIDGTTVASKPTVMPMTAADDNGQMWYGMYDKQRKFSGIDVSTGNNNDDKLQSSMIWGSQYDAMLNWMITGNEKAKVMESNHGNHNYSVVGCGTWKKAENNQDIYDVINNIYDLEGNVSEGTLETLDFYDYKQEQKCCRVERGGLTYDSAYAPSKRVYRTPFNYPDFRIGSRLTLYIK